MPLLLHRRVEQLECIIVVGIVIRKTFVGVFVELVKPKASLAKEMWLPSHEVWLSRTGEVAHDVSRGHRGIFHKSCVDVFSTFFRAHHVHAQHYATRHAKQCLDTSSSLGAALGFIMYFLALLEDECGRVLVNICA